MFNFGGQTGQDCLLKCADGVISHSSSGLEPATFRSERTALTTSTAGPHTNGVDFCALFIIQIGMCMAMIRWLDDGALAHVIENNLLYQRHAAKFWSCHRLERLPSKSVNMRGLVLPKAQQQKSKIYFTSCHASACLSEIWTFPWHHRSHLFFRNLHLEFQQPAVWAKSKAFSNSHERTLLFKLHVNQRMYSHVIV